MFDETAASSSPPDRGRRAPRRRRLMLAHGRLGEGDAEDARHAECQRRMKQSEISLRGSVRGLVLPGDGDVGDLRIAEVLQAADRDEDALA